MKFDIDGLFSNDGKPGFVLFFTYYRPLIK